MMAISDKKLYSRCAKYEGVFTHQAIDTAKLWEDHFKAAITDYGWYFSFTQKIVKVDIGITSQRSPIYGETVYEMVRFHSSSALYVLNTRCLSQSNQLEDLYE
jgi:hypothetical protein